MQLEGKVSKILFQSKKNYYTTFLLRTNNGTKTIVGYFPFLYRSLSLNVFCRKKTHPRYGEQFEASSYEILEPRDINELTDFLISDFIGCELLTAIKISKKLGLHYLKVFGNIEYCASQLDGSELTVNNLESNAIHLSSFYQKKKILEKLMTMGFKQEIACKIAFSEYPPSVESVEENPYLLIKRFGLEWKEIDPIAVKNGIGRASKTRIHQGIYYLVDEAANQKGHMYLPHSVLDEMAHEFLNVPFDLEEEVKQMEVDGWIVRDVKDHVYSNDNYASERRLAENIYRLYMAEPIVSHQGYTFTKGRFPYSDDQQEAIQMAIENQVSIISGPAGTGKTTVLVKIIKECKKLGYNVKLCAPTGRAAKRMTDVTKMKASTIHNLLKFSAESKRPMYNQSLPLEGNCFIIDECSMVDIKVMSFLLDAITTGSKVVFLGDEDQLPSIGPGKLFADLIAYGGFPSKKLSTVFRQEEGSYILDFATKIRNGEHLDFTNVPKSADFRFVQMNDPYAIKQAIKGLVERFVRNNRHDLFEDLQIISPIHNGPIGVKELNTMIQDIVNPSHVGELTIGSKTFRQNDKVLQLVNNLDKEVVNGDIGRIISVDKSSRSILVDFYGNTIEYSDDELFELDLGYVSTVHKVQGGEAKIVMMPFHSSFGSYMVNRKLLYTAVTRAKEFIIVLGDVKTINRAIDTNDVDERFCNVISRLKSERLKTVFK